MWLAGLVAPRHVGSSQTRARTRVPCISRQILNHCATREACNSLFMFYFLIYLAVSGLSCGMRDLSLQCASSSLWHAGFPLVVAWGRGAPEHVGSVAVACRLSFPTACGILVPQPGIEPTSPALEGRFLTTGPPGKSLLQ